MNRTALPYLVGHRGARGEAPENTLPSFQIAMDAGLRAIELDVRLTRDGTLVVLHDASLQRTTGAAGLVRNLEYAALEQLDARQGGPGWSVPVKIPTLDQVVAQCHPDTEFQFEVKGGESSAYLSRVAENLTNLIQRHSMAARTIVTSSDSQFLRLMAQVSPRQSRGLVCEARSFNLVGRTRALGCQWLIPHYSLVKAGLMRRARDAGLRVSVWTVNDLVEAERLAGLGVDSLITDFASGFAAHFAARMQRRGD